MWAPFWANTNPINGSNNLASAKKFSKKNSKQKRVRERETSFGSYPDGNEVRKIGK